MTSKKSKKGASTDPSMFEIPEPSTSNRPPRPRPRGDRLEGRAGALPTPGPLPQANRCGGAALRCALERGTVREGRDAQHRCRMDWMDVTGWTWTWIDVVSFVFVVTGNGLVDVFAFLFCFSDRCWDRWGEGMGRPGTQVAPPMSIK